MLSVALGNNWRETLDEKVDRNGDDRIRDLVTSDEKAENVDDKTRNILTLDPTVGRLDPAVALEYQHASALFQRGFDLIFNLVRGYLYFNGIMIGVVAIAVKSESDNLNSIMMAASAIGVIGSTMTLIVHVRMAGYLRLWLKRASTVERRFGGRLFRYTHRRELKGRKSKFQSYSVSLSAYVLLGLSWLLVFSLRAWTVIVPLFWRVLALIESLAWGVWAVIQPQPISSWPFD
jgi:hypothetical protein